MGVSLRSGTAIDFVEQFAGAAERFAVDVARSDLHAPVPSRPGWSTYDLVCHLGNSHARAATTVETRRSAAAQNDAPASRRPRAVSEWYAGKAEDLYVVLRAVDPATPCWTFVDDPGRVSFWQRRQLHETLVHTVDLDQSQGRTTEVAARLFVDGIDEVLTVFLPRMRARGQPSPAAAPLSLVAVDTHDSWTVRTGTVPTMVPAQPRGRPEETAAGGPGRHLGPDGDRVEGPSDVLFRLLWRRAEADDPALVLRGDRDRIDAFLAARP